MRTSPWLSAMLLSCLAQAAAATDLVDAWQAAVQSDREHAVARAAREAAQPRRDQAAALWRPNVALTASAGLATSETDARGAQFSAPGLGQSSGVGFSTSVTNGTSVRWAVSATQPLYNRERRTQQAQLALSVDVADVEWQAARQSLMLRTAERYFDLALAEESLRVLKQQFDAVRRATTEVEDRFRLGAVPVTDTHEAHARLAGIRAQLLAAEGDVQLKRNRLSDSTGMPATALSARLPAERSGEGPALPLEPLLADAQAGNPSIRVQQLAAQLARQEATKYGQRASPTLDLVAQAGRDRLSGSGDFGSASNTGVTRMLGVQLSVPLFTGGYRDAKETEALRLAAKSDAETERTRQQVAQQVRAAWTDLSVGAGRVQALTEGRTASEARREATQVGHQVGHRTTLDLLNAQNDAAASQLALAQARVGLLLDRLRLAALTGQLAEETLRSVDQGLEIAKP